MNIFRTFWLSVKDLFDELFVLAFVNIIWLVISAPLVVLATVLFFSGTFGLAIVVALLAVVPMAPAIAGLYTVAERITEGRATSWRVFFEGFREHRVLSWRLYGLWMVGLILILVNTQFYSQMQSSLGLFLQILFLYFLLVWFALLIYIGPLMLLQTDKRIRMIARNATLMALGRPIFTLVTLVLMALIVLISIWMPILPIIITFAFLSIWSFRATTTLVAEAEARRIAQEEKAAASAARSASEKGRAGQVRPRD